MLKVARVPLSNLWAQVVRSASTVLLLTCSMLASAVMALAQEDQLSELRAQKEALVADLELQSAQAKEAEKNRRTADGKTAVGYIEAILVAQDGMFSDSGSEAVDFAAAFGASLQALSHLMDAVDAEKVSRKESAAYTKATERAFQLGLEIASIDKKIADLYLEQADARLTLEQESGERVEIPCPKDAVPFAPIFGEGKCYADQYGDDSIAESSFMTHDQAVSIIEFCNESPNAAFCR